MTTCIYCGQEFNPPKPTTPMCQFCWYGGKHHEAQRPQLLSTLRTIDGVTSANIEHTGGGCFGLAVRLTDGRFLFATDAVKDGDDWFCEANVPDVDQPWGLGIYANEDGDDGFGSGEAVEPIRVPLSDADLIDAVRTIAAAKGGQS